MQTIIEHLNPKFTKFYPKDKKNWKKDTIIGDVFIYDQFDQEFEYLINKYNTAGSICGYASLANIQILHKYGVDEGFMQIREERQKYIEDAMRFIKNARETYASNNPILSQDQQQFNNYLKDWVANYEISDYLKELKLQNVYFVRNIAQEYPEQLAKVQFEELERIKEEEQFMGDNYFIYYGYDNKFIRRKEFEFKGTQYFIIDTLGHFMCITSEFKFNKHIIVIFDTMQHDNLENICIRRFLRLDK
ncbi:hypothetical protein pb186bvf_020046 [Paramecium bursaria]